LTAAPYKNYLSNSLEKWWVNYELWIMNYKLWTLPAVSALIFYGGVAAKSR
jgi:hypothetical protein